MVTCDAITDVGTRSQIIGANTRALAKEGIGIEAIAYARAIAGARAEAGIGVGAVVGVGTGA